MKIKSESVEEEREGAAKWNPAGEAGCRTAGQKGEMMSWICRGAAGQEKTGGEQKRKEGSVSVQQSQTNTYVTT